MLFPHSKPLSAWSFSDGTGRVECEGREGIRRLCPLEPMPTEESDLQRYPPYLDATLTDAPLGSRELPTRREKPLHTAVTNRVFAFSFDGELLSCNKKRL